MGPVPWGSQPTPKNRPTKKIEIKGSALSPFFRQDLTIPIIVIMKVEMPIISYEAPPYTVYHQYAQSIGKYHSKAIIAHADVVV